MGAHMLADAAAIGDWLGSLPRPPEVRRRFAALDTLGRSGRLAAVMGRTAGLDAERAWSVVLDAAAGLEPVDRHDRPTRGLPVGRETMRARFAVAHEARGERACDLARRLDLPYPVVERALWWCQAQGWTERRDGRWCRVQEGRPW